MKKFIINNLSKSFGEGIEEKKIFENLNLEIKSDEITVIVGKSGCGKTTLLRMIGGLDKNYSGEIKYLNGSKEEKYKLGFVFQEPRLMPWLNVEENIFIHKKEKNINDEEVEKILSLVSLDKINKMHPHELSGGMGSRVGIGRALSYNPDVLLMDEPFASLDYFTRESLQKVIIDIYEKTNKGIIFVTHNLNEGLLLGNRIIVLYKGEYKSFYIDKVRPRNLEDVELVKIKKEIKKYLEIV